MYFMHDCCTITHGYTNKKGIYGNFKHIFIAQSNSYLVKLYAITLLF